MRTVREALSLPDNLDAPPLFANLGRLSLESDRTLLTQASIEVAEYELRKVQDQPALLLCSDENPTAFSLGFRAWLQKHPRYTLLLLVPAELLTVPQAWALLGYRHVVFGYWSI